MKNSTAILRKFVFSLISIEFEYLTFFAFAMLFIPILHNRKNRLIQICHTWAIKSNFALRSIFILLVKVSKKIRQGLFYEFALRHIGFSYIRCLEKITNAFVQRIVIHNILNLI